jgi:hypothetical protein
MVCLDCAWAWFCVDFGVMCGCMKVVSEALASGGGGGGGSQVFGAFDRDKTDAYIAALKHRHPQLLTAKGRSKAFLKQHFKPAAAQHKHKPAKPKPTFKPAPTARVVLLSRPATATLRPTATAATAGAAAAGEVVMEDDVPRARLVSGAKHRAENVFAAFARGVRAQSAALQRAQRHTQRAEWEVTHASTQPRRHAQGAASGQALDDEEEEEAEDYYFEDEDDDEEAQQPSTGAGLALL